MKFHIKESNGKASSLLEYQLPALVLIDIGTPGVLKISLNKHASIRKVFSSEESTSIHIKQVKAQRNLQTSGQIIIFHLPRFSWNNGISLTKPPFKGSRSCEVAIIWPETWKPEFHCELPKKNHNLLFFDCQIGSSTRNSPQKGWTYVPILRVLLWFQSCGHEKNRLQATLR